LWVLTLLLATSFSLIVTCAVVCLFSLPAVYIWHIQRIFLMHPQYID
jgi:hypothetical protein